MIPECTRQLISAIDRKFATSKFHSEADSFQAICSFNAGLVCILEMTSTDKVGSRLVEVAPGKSGGADSPSVSPIYRSALASNGFRPQKDDARSLFEVFENSVRAFPDRPCLGRRINGTGPYVWESYKVRDRSLVMGRPLKRMLWKPRTKISSRVKAKLTISLLPLKKSLWLSEPISVVFQSGLQSFTLWLWSRQACDCGHDSGSVAGGTCKGSRHRLWSGNYRGCSSWKSSSLLCQLPRVDDGIAGTRKIDAVSVLHC